MSEELVEAQKDTILSAHEHTDDNGVIVEEHNAPVVSDIGDQYIPTNLLAEAVVDETGNNNSIPPITNNVDQQNTEYEQYDLSAYRWQQNGRKIFKVPEKNETIRRQHWRCSNWDKPTKEKGCKAKYRIDIYANGKPASEPCKSDAPHNHPPPPERGRVDMETQLQMAVSPMKREKAKRAPTSPIKEENGQYPSSPKRQCTDATTTATVELEQQVAAIQSVMRLFESYGDHFTRKVDLYPSIRAIFASPKGLEDLIKNSDSVVISSDYISLGLTLVIFSVLANGEESAVLWLISNSRDAENYELMLRYVDEITEGRLKPDNVVIGADPGFREAFLRVFPSCTFLLPNTAAITNASAAPLLTSDPQPPTQLTSLSAHSVIASTILSSLERSASSSSM